MSHAYDVRVCNMHVLQFSHRDQVKNLASQKYDPASLSRNSPSFFLLLRECVQCTTRASTHARPLPYDYAYTKLSPEGVARVGNHFVTQIL